MNNKRFIITAPVLAVAALVLTSTESNAKVPPEDPSPTAAVPNHALSTQPSTTTSRANSADDTTSEVLRAATSGLGGAGIALAGVWLYRRRPPHAA